MDFFVRKVLFELGEKLDITPPETVDALVRIAYTEKVAVFLGNDPHDGEFNRRDVLELVNEDVVVLFLKFFAEDRIIFQKNEEETQKIAEVQKIIFPLQKKIAVKNGLFQGCCLRLFLQNLLP
ncbi:hypothetical protein SDC9_158798 [bioreactor metagenome]|uniref:Uncharacterized protein n=1 Tax=bioreactor metagenome TaxID=1076179 RepID=A0A645FAU1_9ZZZZ